MSEEICFLDVRRGDEIRLLVSIVGGRCGKWTDACDTGMSPRGLTLDVSACEIGYLHDKTHEDDGIEGFR